MPVETVDGSNPSPFKKPNPPAHVPPTRGEMLRTGMTRWALWCIANRSQFGYTMGPGRSHMVDSKAGSLPQEADCSGLVEGLARWEGASDPSGLNFNPVGYTGTLLDHCNSITVDEARMGDLIVYTFADGPATGDHVVYIMERLAHDDFWVCSHGKPGDPSRVLHSACLAYFGPDSARFLRWIS